MQEAARRIKPTPSSSRRSSLTGSTATPGAKPGKSAKATKSGSRPPFAKLAIVGAAVAAGARRLSSPGWPCVTCSVLCLLLEHRAEASLCACSRRNGRQGGEALSPVSAALFKAEARLPPAATDCQSWGLAQCTRGDCDTKQPVCSARCSRCCSLPVGLSATMDTAGRCQGPVRRVARTSRPRSARLPARSQPARALRASHGRRTRRRRGQPGTAGA